MYSFITVFICITLFCSVYSRPSFYYSNKDSAGYHAPYDFSQNTSPNPTCNSLCSGSQTIQSNTSFNAPAAGSCRNVPDFLTTQTNLPGLDFGNCCSAYESCAYSCSSTKDSCDQQFYGCMFAQCGYNYRVRPADRIMCRAYALCYASYSANNMTCERFNTVQGQACYCSNNGVAPTQNVTVVGRSVEQRQTNNVTQTVPSSSSNGNNNNNNNNNNNSNVSWVPYPVPLWSAVGAYCPPSSIGSYINVMSDQEMDDISYYPYGASSSLSSWLRFVF